MRIFIRYILLGLLLTIVSYGQSIYQNVSAGTNISGYKPAKAGIENILASSITDYYRTKTSGRWDSPSTWESSPDSINWTDATMSPNDSSNTIIVSMNDTVHVFRSVFVNQIMIDSGAVVIVNEEGSDTNVVFYITKSNNQYDLIVKGTLIATGSPPLVSPFTVNAFGKIDFEPGSVYEHRQDGGGIPISTWQLGSTLKLTGVKSNPPANKAQNYSNIVVNLPELQFHLNMGFQDNVITGNIYILNTSTNRFVLVGPETDTVRTVTNLGNIYQSAGNFNSHGTENPYSTAILHSMGDIFVTGGNFSVVRGSQGGTGTTTWYLHGSLSMQNATTQNGNPSGAKFVFTGPGEHQLNLSNVTFAEGGLPIEVDTAVLNIGTSVLLGNGMFSLSPFSTLLCAMSAGLDSVFLGTGTIILSPEANYGFNAMVPQVTGTRLPGQVNGLFVKNLAGVSLSSDVVVNTELDIQAGTLSLNGKTITIGPAAIMSDTTGTVTGITGKITTTRDISTSETSNIAGMGIVIRSGENLGMTTIERYHYPALISGNNGIFRQYKIIPANTLSSGAVLRFYYKESELDTIPESSLGIFTSSDGNTWERRDGIIDTDSNYAEVTSLTGASYWTLAYAAGPVSVRDRLEGVPEQFFLYQNYPNPFNPETTISFDLPEDSYVDLSVYNLLGEKVVTLVNGRLEKGRYTKDFKAGNLPSGVYIYKIEADKYSFTRKMILMK